MLFVVFLFLPAIMGVIGFVQAGNAGRLENEIARLNKEKQRHAKTLALIKQLEKDKALIEKQIAIIKQLKKSSSLTVHILDEVAKVTRPDRIWLTSLTQNGTNLQLSGMALDNRTIAKYMEDLKMSPYMSSVNLQSSSLKSYAGRNLKAFSLACSTAVPDEKKSEETEKK